MRKLLWIIILSLFSNVLIAQQPEHFQVKPLKNIKKTVRQNLKGFGVRIKNVRYKGKRRAIGAFWKAESVLQMSHGLVLSTGQVVDAKGENDNQGKTGVNHRKGHRLFKLVSSEKLYDAAVLQFDFYPSSNYISFNFVFASEDYPEFIHSGLNDVLAFILTLPNGEQVNLAKLPNSKDLVSVASINPTNQAQYYINNSSQKIKHQDSPLDTFSQTTATHKLLLTRCWDIKKAMTSESQYPIQYDGFTKVLQAKYPVKTNQKHRLQIAIADNGNSIFDSAVFIEMESLHSYKDSSYQTGILRKNPSYYYQIDTLSSTRIRSVITENPSKPAICLKQPADLLFNYDSPKINSLNESLLNDLSKQLQECSDLNLKIIGYAAAKDNRYNRKLSRERAENVKIYLIQLGVQSDRIDVNWQGDGAQKTKKALSQNRRVKLEVFTR